jgi:hypothetical protein
MLKQRFNRSEIDSRNGAKILKLSVLLSAVPALLIPYAAPKPPSPPAMREIPDEVVIYAGSEEADKRWHHGGFRAAVGVHKIQILRANRTHGPEGEAVGWTYNHAPMLAYRHDRFWINYVTNRVEEHGAPGRTGLLSSADGYTWEPPAVAFPVVSLPEIQPPPRYFRGRDLPVLPAGTESQMHQRMGFYVAPNGRFLTSGFYSYCPSIRFGPNRGQGLGRVVREVYPDGRLGPIYFVRYNRHAGWDEHNTPFPFYTGSGDQGFVEACEALIADRLVTLQWWEDDRSEDGFFTSDIPDRIELKALSYYQRPDGITVGLAKSGLAGLTPDGGKTWSWGRHSFPEAGAKIWGQRTDDGRYALVYCHSATNRNRFPLVVVTGDDGYSFDNLLLLHGEVPPMRYRGANKAVGPQYVRGIVPGNGDPPGDHLWLTYSMNKEDLWIARVRVPLSATVETHLNETFEEARRLADLEEWNLYVPQWAAVSLVPDPWNASNQVLRLRDEDPYDYVKVERVIPSSGRVRVSFRMMQKANGLNGLEFEAQTERGGRPMRLWWSPEEVGFDIAGTEVERAAIGLGRWHRFVLELDCEARRYSVSIDGVMIHANLRLEDDPNSIDRLVFRTGPWRMDVRQFIMEEGEPGNPGVWDADLPGADHKAPASVYLIDDLKTEPF